MKNFVKLSQIRSEMQILSCLLPGFEAGISLGNGIDNTDKTDQYYKARRKKVHDELKGIFHLKGPHKGFDAEKKKKY